MPKDANGPEIGEMTIWGPKDRPDMILDDTLDRVVIDVGPDDRVIRDCIVKARTQVYPRSGAIVVHCPLIEQVARARRAADTYVLEEDGPLIHPTRAEVEQRLGEWFRKMSTVVVRKKREKRTRTPKRPDAPPIREAQGRRGPQQLALPHLPPRQPDPRGR